MKPSIKRIISLANDLRSSMGATTTPRRSLAPNQYERNLSRLNEATDWSSGRDAVRRASNTFNGADDDQISGMLDGIEAAIARLLKAKLPDGPNWKSSRAGFDDAVANAKARAISARQEATESGDVEKIASDLLARIKAEMPLAENTDDIYGLSDAFAALGDTPLFDSLVKEGLVQGLSEKGVSHILKMFSKAGKVSEVDAISTAFSSGTLRKLLGADAAQLDAIRTAAVKARLKLLKKAYADVGQLAGKNREAAVARMNLIDSYIQRRMTDSFRMFDDKQRAALGTARTAAFGKITSAPMVAPQPSAGAAGSSRRALGPATPDADPLARPLRDEGPPMAWDDETLLG